MDFQSASNGGLLGAPFFHVLRKRKKFKKPCDHLTRPAVIGYGARSYLGQSRGSNAGHLLRARIRPLPPRRYGHCDNAAITWPQAVNEIERFVLVAAQVYGCVMFYRLLFRYLEKTHPLKEALASVPHHSTSVHFRPFLITSTISPRYRAPTTDELMLLPLLTFSISTDTILNPDTDGASAVKLAKQRDTSLSTAFLSLAVSCFFT